MTKNTILLYFIISICCFISCELKDESFLAEEYNDVSALDLLQPTIAQMAFNHSALSGRSTAAIVQFLKEQVASITFYRDYNMDRSFFDDMWSNGYYGGSLSSANEMKRLAEEENNEALVAISLIVMAHEYAALTNMFGDIPFSESLKGENNLTPKYDSQEAVYAGLIDLLDEANGKIGNEIINPEISNDDLLMHGNMQNWKKLSNGLKARLLLNQRNKFNGNDSEILSLIEGAFENRNEQAEFDFTSDFVNPLYKIGEERPSTYLCGDYFVNQLNATLDPRASSYTFWDGGFWQYFGSPDLIWSEMTASIPILSYTELMFIRTEVLFYAGAGENEISASLSEAITSSLMDNNVAINNPVMSFISTASNLSGLNSESIHKRIIEQSYMSYYGFNHLQAWNNYRRTGYPNISSTAIASNELNPSNVIPRRFLYPTSEFDFNGNNVQEAVSRQNAEFLDSDIWIFE